MEVFAIMFSMIFFAFPFMIMLFALLPGAASLAFTIWMIIDCYKSDFKDREIWLVVLLGGLIFQYGLIAALIYYFVVKTQKK